MAHQTQPKNTPIIQTHPLSIGFTTIPNCFCLLISITFRWEFECRSAENVGLLAGRYSGTNLPDLNLTPQALHNVFGPNGPARHCGVFSAPQCKHFLPIPAAPVVAATAAAVSVVGTTCFRFFELGCCLNQRWWPEICRPRRRLLRALPGTFRPPQQLIRMLLPWTLVLLPPLMVSPWLLIEVLSRTETGLFCFETLVNGGGCGAWWWWWSERMSTNVSTAGNASSFDNHSSSSSA